MQRHLFAAMILVASAAAAAPVPGLAPLPRDIPASCAALAKVPSASIPGPTLAAHVSVANCMAEVGMNAVAQTADDASIANFDRAVAPSIDIFDSVIRAGDPYWKVVAENAKLDTYESMIVRERVSIPGSDFAAHAALEPKLVRWQEDAHETLAAIAELAHANPALAQRDPVISGVIARAVEQTRTPQMATRR
jgi:hypothetical protein